MTTRFGNGSVAGRAPNESEEPGRASTDSGSFQRVLSEDEADRLAEKFRPSWESPEPVPAHASPARVAEQELPVESTRRSRPPKTRSKEKEDAVVPDAIGVISPSKNAFLYVGIGAAVVVVIAAFWVWDLGKGAPTAAEPIATETARAEADEPTARAETVVPPAVPTPETAPSAATATAAPTPTVAPTTETPAATPTQEASPQPEVQVAIAPAPMPAAAMPAAPAVVAPAPTIVPTPPPAPPPPAPVLVSVRIRTEPSNAVLTVDGRSVTNPFDQRFEKNSARHRIEARLDGYRNASQSLAFDADRETTLRLEQIPVARPAPVRPAPTRPAPTRPAQPQQRRQARPSGGFVSDNPFD